jgi:hypothetical protein
VNGHGFPWERLFAIQDRSISIQERILIDQAVHNDRMRNAVETQSRVLEDLPHRLATAIQAPAATPAPAHSSSPSHHDWIELMHAGRRLLMVAIPFVMVLLLALGRVTVEDIRGFAGPLAQSSAPH